MKILNSIIFAALILTVSSATGDDSVHLAIREQIGKTIVNPLLKKDIDSARSEEKKVCLEGDKDQTLTFNFLVNLTQVSTLVASTNFLRSPFTQHPLVIVVTPDGQVLSKPLQDSFDITNQKVFFSQTEKIVVRNPLCGPYLYGLEIPPSLVDIDATLESSSFVFSSRDHLKTLLVESIYFVPAGQKFQAFNPFIYVPQDR